MKLFYLFDSFRTEKFSRPQLFKTLKKKNRQSGSTKWHCKCTTQKHCTRIRNFIYKKKEHKSMIGKKKKKYILNKPKKL